MAKLDPQFIAAEPASTVDENALLRASLEEARRRIETLEQSSGNDPLTGLPSRSRLVEALGRVVGLAERHQTQSALLTIDLKGLRWINEMHGRIGGDAVLVHVARTLQSLIRSTDFLAHSGGGEFALLLDHLDLDSAIETGERISRCIASTPAELGGRSVDIAASVGVTGIMAGDDVENVLRRAAAAMRFAKDDRA